MSIVLKPVAVEIRLRNVISRMPGKYGATISLGAPLTPDKDLSLIHI